MVQWAHSSHAASSVFSCNLRFPEMSIVLQCFPSKGNTGGPQPCQMDFWCFRMCSAGISTFLCEVLVQTRPFFLRSDPFLIDSPAWALVCHSCDNLRCAFLPSSRGCALVACLPRTLLCKLQQSGSVIRQWTGLLKLLKFKLFLRLPRSFGATFFGAASSAQVGPIGP